MVIGTSKENKIFVGYEGIGVVGSGFGEGRLLGDGCKPGAVEVE